MTDNKTGLIVIGQGWGDESKSGVCNGIISTTGSTLNVRFSGGPQRAGHTTMPDGRYHCFASFGSGSFHKDVRTHISKTVLVEPYALLNEAAALSKVGVPDIAQRLTIDPEAVLITPWHWLTNRVREMARGAARHGSGGMGIGECRSMQLRGLALHIGNLKSRDLTRAILEQIRQSAILSLPSTIPVDALPIYNELMHEKVEPNVEFYRDWAHDIRQTRSPVIDGPVVFEGSQGVMLDEKLGSAPHNSWTNCTFENAVSLCREWGLEPVKIGVLRTYSTRHGEGPFITHDPAYDFPDHNKGLDNWQGEFRQGPLDLMAARYAVRMTRPDCLAITHLDRVGDVWEHCLNYTLNGTHHTPDFSDAQSVFPCSPVISRTAGENALSVIGSQLGVPIRYTTAGPTHKDFREVMAGKATA